MTDTTLAALVDELAAFSGDTPLSFETELGEISGGYHVTELKRIDVTSIDCAGTTSVRREAAVQLLDGGGGALMSLGRFRGILDKSIAVVDGLAEAPVFFEFGHGNARLERRRLRGLREEGGRVVLRLEHDRASCRPLERMVGRRVAARECCGA